MRKAWLLLLLAPSALVYACSGDSTTTDGGTDATASDAAPDVAKQDTGTQDTGTQDTGVQDSGGPDVTLNVTCLRPANCIDGGDQDAAYAPDSGEVCCGTITGNGSTQSCQIVGASTACSAPTSCATNFSGLTTCSSATVRLCSSAAECTEAAYNKCCVANAGDGGVPLQICASTTIATLSGGKIVCP